jgi:predicted DNA-binding transcriptional regulator YafY
LHNGVTKVCSNCGSVKPLSDFEDKSLVTGIGKVCFKCKAESKTKKARRKYEAKKARRKNNTKIVVKKDPRTIKTDYNISSIVSFKESTLRVGLNHHKSVKILYKGKWRTIDPYALNDTYVVAYCHLSNDIRTFRIDRIENIVLSGSFSFDKYLQTTAQSGLRQAPNYNWKKNH